MIRLQLSVSECPIILIGPGGFAISSPPPIRSPSFNFMDGVENKK
jgi:hypothetical protein